VANPRTSGERRQNGKIEVSSVVFVIKGSKAAQKLIIKGIKAAGECYRVEGFMNASPESRCEVCCG
jgi:hypothetical protein